MTKQRPDPDKMANELSGASAFFKRTAPVPPRTPAPGGGDEGGIPADGAVDLPMSQTAPAVHPAEPVRPVRPVRRLMIRHPFELYADQLERLREVADQQKRQGESGSMSKMVRAAIDRLLDEQRV